MWAHASPTQRLSARAAQQNKKRHDADAGHGHPSMLACTSAEWPLWLVAGPPDVQLTFPAHANIGGRACTRQPPPSG